MKTTPRRARTLLLTLGLLLSFCACAQKEQTEEAATAARHERPYVMRRGNGHTVGAGCVFAGGGDLAWMAAGQD